MADSKLNDIILSLETLSNNVKKMSLTVNELTDGQQKLTGTVNDLFDGQHEILEAISYINKRLLEHDDRFNELSGDVSDLKEYTYAGFDTMNARFDRLEDQFDRLSAEIGSGGYQH